MTCDDDDLDIIVLRYLTENQRNSSLLKLTLTPQEAAYHFNTANQGKSSKIDETIDVVILLTSSQIEMTSKIRVILFCSEDNGHFANQLKRRVAKEMPPEEIDTGVVTAQHEIVEPSLIINFEDLAVFLGRAIILVCRTEMINAGNQFPLLPAGNVSPEETLTKLVEYPFNLKLAQLTISNESYEHSSLDVVVLDDVVGRRSAMTPGRESTLMFVEYYI
jgi:hypothetical protein